MAFDDLSRYKNETLRTKWDFLVMRLPVAFYVCQSPWVNKTLLCSRPSIIGWYLGVIGSNLSSDLKSMSNTSHMLIVKFIFIYDQNKKINFCCFIVTMLMNWSVGTAEKYKVYFLNRCIQINQVRFNKNHNLIREEELITDNSNAHKVICSKKVVIIVDGSPSKLNVRL